MFEPIPILIEEFQSVVAPDSIIYDTVLVRIDKYDKHKLKVLDVEDFEYSTLEIRWNPTFLDYEPFARDYMSLILIEMDEELLLPYDSIFFETSIPNSNIALTSYSASRNELKQLMKEQRNRSSDYFDFIHFIMKSELVFTIEYFDLYLARCRELSFKDDSFSWMDEGFLSYVEKYFYPSMEIEELKSDQLIILRDFIGDGVIWHMSRGPYDVVNYLLEDVGEEPLHYELSDTMKYGIHPAWFSEVGVN